ncbi:uncharacterized protein LOC132547502 [Ylistrum balloti]|uniref:uncharacterized protein LOC132547502 n=1 Tax=Ylistrum balloti TaxID=509963 RepID=UPI002905C552|nr:uncharacterized protein LOC132547502 [Ylistrum balloti]
MYIRVIIFLIVLNLVLSVNITKDDIINLNTVKYVQGFRLRTGVFRVYENTSYTSCVRECLRRRQCVAISYHLVNFYCHLGSQTSDIENVGDNKIISSHPTDWNPPKSIVGNCSEMPCAIGQRCTELSSGKVVCVNTECPDPPEMTSSTTSSLRTVGITISYEYVADASNPAIVSGNPNITCKTDNTWTYSDYTVKLCPSDFQVVAGTYCVLIVTDQRLAPAKGDEYCQTKGGRLIWMTSVDKFDAVVAVIDTGRYFLAGSDADVEGTWKLPDGEPMTWVHSRAETIDTDNEDCLTYDHSYKKLRDFVCTGAKLFICEIA